MNAIFLQLTNKLGTWLHNYRVICSFLAGLTMMQFYITRYAAYAKALGYPVQVFESYCWLSSQPRAFCFVMLGGLLLVADSPFLTPLSPQEMIRLGRKAWVKGQIFYIFAASLIYFSVLVAVSAIYTTATAGTYLLGGWSKPIQILAYQQPLSVLEKYKVSFSFPELLEAISPTAALLESILLQSAYLSLISLITLAINLLFKANCGWVFGSGFHFLNYMIQANANFGMQAKYSLLCCAIPGYQFSPDVDMPPYYCIGAFALCIATVTDICISNASRIEPFE